MKLNDYREAFYTFSGKASDLNRQLAFAGIALIWLFKRDVGAQLTIPSELLYPAVFIVASLALDMLHYCIAASIWHWFYRTKERAGVTDNAQLKRHSPSLEWPIYSIFWAKIAFVLMAYIGIFVFLLRALSI
jgi:hypothetical protein